MAAPARVYSPTASGPLRQCELLSGLVEPRTRPEGLASTDKEIITDTRKHQLAIIVTQDCELEGDYRARNTEPVDLKKLIDTVLLCDVFSEEETREAAKQIGLDSKAWKRVRQNRDERFHYLQAVSKEDDSAGTGFGPLGVDFKRLFALTPELLYGQIGTIATRRFKLKSPYLEHLVVRFFAYQSRVALPNPHIFDEGK